MFCKRNSESYKKVGNGVQRRTLLYGNKTIMVEFKLSKGAVIEIHRHPEHEQTGYLVKGGLHFFIGQEDFDVQPGDSWCIPESVDHRVEVLKNSHVVEVFSPVREDYLP